MTLALSDPLFILAIGGILTSTLPPLPFQSPRGTRQLHRAGIGSQDKLEAGPRKPKLQLVIAVLAMYFAGPCVQGSIGLTAPGQRSNCAGGPLHKASLSIPETFQAGKSATLRV